MNPMINIGIQAVREASKLLLRSMEHLESVDIKFEDRCHFTAELKRLASEEITTVIQKAHPSHAVTTTDASNLGLSGETCWLVDAINGEDNFIHGLPHFAISLAIKLQNKITAGIIYDFLRDELFIAAQGQGARLNDRRLRVSQTKKLNDSLLGSAEHDVELSRRCQGLRHSGCAALDLAYVAAARLDGYWQNSVNDIETAAGILLAKEAGAIVSNFNTENVTKTQILLVANPKLHKELLVNLSQTP